MLGLRPGWMAQRGERTDRWTENLPILQDFVPYQGRGPKIDIHIQHLRRRGGEEGGIMREKERERRRRWRRRRRRKMRMKRSRREDKERSGMITKLLLARFALKKKGIQMARKQANIVGKHLAWRS